MSRDLARVERHGAEIRRKRRTDIKSEIESEKRGRGGERERESVEALAVVFLRRLTLRRRRRAPFPFFVFPFAFVNAPSPRRDACELWFLRLFRSQIWPCSAVSELLESQRVESRRCRWRRSAFRVGFWTELFSPCRSVFLRWCLICAVVVLPRAPLCSFAGVRGWAPVGFDIKTRLFHSGRTEAHARGDVASLCSGGSVLESRLGTRDGRS